MLRKLYRGIFLKFFPALSLILFTLIVVMSALAPIIATEDPLELKVFEAFEPPGGKYILGTDDLGRDVFSRLLYGGRISLNIALTSAIAAGFFGLLIGMVSGYFKKIDLVLMAIMDGLNSFPGIILALATVAALGTSHINVIISLVLVFTPNVSRVVRSTMLVLREMDYVVAAKALGISDFQIIYRHLVPNAMAPWLVQVTMILAFALLAESGLSFLGVGGSTDLPSWGGIIAEGRLVIGKAPWLVLLPGVLITLTVLSINILGDALRDIIDPQLQGR
jgi:peptide/nickel transport system permease protein